MPRDLEAICLACLEPDPARRLADAGLVAGALRQFLEAFVTQFPCSRCSKAIKSKKPLRVGTTVVRCPHCGEQSVVEPFGGKTPSSSSPERPGPAPAQPSLADPSPPPRTEPARHASSRPAGPPATHRATGGPDPGWDSTFAPPAGPEVSPSRPLLPSTPRMTPSGSQAAGLPIVAGYALLSELGRGGMGVVYKAKHEKLKRLVALKMVSMYPQDDPQELARFQAEAEAVARLHHPNIVQIYEVGEQDGSPYLALEFVTGGTLRNRLDGRPSRSGRPCNWSSRSPAPCMRPTSAASSIATSSRPTSSCSRRRRRITGTGHRPARSRPTRSTGSPRSRISGWPSGSMTFDAPGHHGGLVGTPVYMAPEQAKGPGEEIGPAADIYSLGVILYEMLTGRPPFVSSSAADVLRQVLSDPPVPPRRLRRELPRDLEAVCQRCLEKDPRRRYPTALALADDLGSFLDGEPVRARHPGPAERVWNWSLKNPVPSTLLLTVTAVLVFGQWSLHRLADRMVESTTRENAAQQTELIKVVNSLYTDVAARPRTRASW